jgi:hypothetical protein
VTFEKIGKGIVKRTTRRVLGLFIDGTGLDRATRRINRKVDLAALVRGVTSGIQPVVARYYTLIPYEDDSRQRSFLDAVARAHLSVVVKRLPPKGITRQVSVDVEMAADIVAFARGHSSFSNLSEYQTESEVLGSPRHTIPLRIGTHHQPQHITPAGPAPETATDPASAVPLAPPPVVPVQEERVVVVVCPSRDLSYPIALVKELHIDTVTADFGQFNTGDILKSAAKWIDLSDSETIWRD